MQVRRTVQSDPTTELWVRYLRGKMAEALLLETEEQYDRAITNLGMGQQARFLAAGLASSVDDLVMLLREAVQDQYTDARAMYEESYGWETSPEPFEAWLDHEFPQLADLPEWVFAQKVEDGS